MTLRPTTCEEMQEVHLKAKQRLETVDIHSLILVYIKRNEPKCAGDMGREQGVCFPEGLCAYTQW